LRQRRLRVCAGRHSRQFVEAAKAWGGKHCPDINSADYTSIIDQRAYQRLQDAMVDAEQKAQTQNIAAGQAANPRQIAAAPVCINLNGAVTA
jgi:hypothetical protein